MSWASSRLTFVLVAHSGLNRLSRSLPERRRRDGVRRVWPDRASVERYRQPNVEGLILTDSFAPVEQHASRRSCWRLVAGGRRQRGARARGCASDRQWRSPRDTWPIVAEALALGSRTLAEAHYNLGVGLHQTGRPGEARDAWRRAIALKGDHAEAHHNLGASLYAEGDLRRAEQHLATAVRLRPGSEEMQHALGVVRMRLVEREAADSGEFAAISAPVRRVTGED